MALFTTPSDFAARLREVRATLYSQVPTTTPFGIATAAHRDLSDYASEVNLPLVLYVLPGQSSGETDTESTDSMVTVTYTMDVVVYIRDKDIRGAYAADGTAFFREFLIKAIHGWTPIEGQYGFEYTLDLPPAAEGHAELVWHYQFAQDIVIARSDLDLGLGSWCDEEWFRVLQGTINADTGTTLANVTNYNPTNGYDFSTVPTLTIAAGDIAVAADMTNNSRDAAQVVVGQRPLFLDKAIDSDYAAAQFANASSHDMDFDGTPLVNSAVTVYAVVRRTSNKIDNWIVGGLNPVANQSLNIGWATDTSFVVSVLSGASDVTATVAAFTASDWIIVTAQVSDSLGGKVWFNGTLAASNATGSLLTSFSGPTLGSAENSKFADMDLAQIWFYNGTHDDTTRQIIEASIAWDYPDELVSKLDSDNPYKSAPPAKVT